MYIIDENARGSLPLGLVIDVNVGRDGLVCGACLKTKIVLPGQTYHKASIA